jgi:uncharacterized protein
MRIFDLLNRRTELPTPDPPAEVGRRDGLAYALFLPREEPRGGVVIVHGAGSSKESHFDFARACRSAGYAAVTYDQRGHGESEGCLDGRLLDDAAAMAALLPQGPLALRGSSMGGYVALLAAAHLDAAAVVAICPAGTEHLLRSLRAGRLEFEADSVELERFLEDHDLTRCVAEMRTPMLLLHAEGDEQIPVEHSSSLYGVARMPHKRLIALPGGHHRSIQHDPELQGEALRFIDKSFAAAAAG